MGSVRHGACERCCRTNMLGGDGRCLGGCPDGEPLGRAGWAVLIAVMVAALMVVIAWTGILLGGR